MSQVSELLRERAVEETINALDSHRTKMVLLHHTLADLYSDLARRHDRQNLRASASTQARARRA